MAKASKSLIKSPGIDVQFLVDAEDSGGSTTAFIARVAPGAQTPPAHKHDGWDETVYCTQGTMSYLIDGEKVDLAQGDAVCVRRGQPHKFHTHTTEDAGMLFFPTPGFFEEDYSPSVPEIPNPPTDAPPDIAPLLSVKPRH